MQTLFAILTILSFAAMIRLRHSFFMVPLIVFLSLWVQDFFPLSHFPMYSDPDESENYFYVASVDESGTQEALPVRALTSITAPKVKKMYKSWAREYADSLEKRDRDLTKEERAKVGRDLLTFLKKQAVERNREMPPKLALVEVWIVYDNETGFSETPETVAVLETASIPAKSEAPEASS
jgi:hypothetical protein